MRNTHRHRPAALLLAVVTVLVLVGAACGSDDSDSSSSTTAGGDTTTTTTESDDQAFVKDVQGQLQQIGCYDGEIDGDDGPATTSAIEAFQTAEGLEVDGEVGTSTEEALKAAVASGRHDVCASGGGATSTTGGDATSTTGGGGGPTSTTSGGGGGNLAPCTHDAIQSGLASGETLDQWQCARDSSGQDYAGGTQHKDGADRTDFILWAKDGKWTSYTGSCDAVPGSLTTICENATS